MSKPMIPAEMHDIELLGKPIKLQVFKRKTEGSDELDYETREISVGYLDGFFKNKDGWVIYLRGMGTMLINTKMHYFEIYTEGSV